MNVDDMTVREVKAIAAMFSPPAPPAARRLPLQVGATIFIRTVTHHLTGVITAWSDEEIALKSAAWIADDGRFSDAIKTGIFAEVEPYPDDMPVFVNRGSIIDCAIVSWAAPRLCK